MLDVSYKITLLMVASWSEIRCRENCFWEASPRIYSKTKRIEASCTTLSSEIKASFTSKTSASFLDDDTVASPVSEAANDCRPMSPTKIHDHFR